MKAPTPNDPPCSLYLPKVPRAEGGDVDGDGQRRKEEERQKDLELEVPSQHTSIRQEGRQVHEEHRTPRAIWELRYTGLGGAMGSQLLKQNKSRMTGSRTVPGIKDNTAGNNNAEW